jgi:two-component system OmpR family sensor kinase
MFSSFARRLTGWYVVAAAIVASLVVAGFAVLALSFYVRVVNEGIDDGARAASSFQARAKMRGETFLSSALEFESRDHRTGVRILAAQFAHPQQEEKREAQSSYPLLLRPGGGPQHKPPGPSVAKPPPPPSDDHIKLTVVDGRVYPRDMRSLRFEGGRLGFAVATVFGSHLRRVTFLDGDMFFVPNPDTIQAVTLWLLAGVVLVGFGAGALAWFTGRYITSQVLQPLVEVTHALQRFAARDFTPQPIAVAGKSEFDAIALAYNAAAAQVAKAFDERGQVEQQMRQFVADAGHELRTPLTIVLGYIDLLRRRADEGDERSRRIFAAIASEGARMRTLIDNLVLLAKMEGADVRVTEPFALRPLLEEIVDARRVVAPNVRFELDLPVDATVIGHREEIHEAIANVVDNAIKYAAGSPIRISASAVDSSVEVRVSDRGPGIPLEERGSIFERFYRGATRGDVEGSGLGLPIAKRAVERAGGSLALDESANEGTTFVFKLRTDGAPVKEARPSRA